MWNNDYYDLISEWSELRNKAKILPIYDALHLIHDWWQQAPIVSPYLEILEPESWPNPWELLANNGFCDLAKCLGICYTIQLLNRKEINSLRIVQTDNYYILVIVNDGEFVLNDRLGEIEPMASKINIIHIIDMTHTRIK